ncbi:hypothetical protein JCM18899A_26150 [Nocardioides sp. AN3]
MPGASGPNLAIATSVDPHATVVEVSGELDTETSPLLRRAVEEAIAVRPATLVLDVQQLSFMDSYGIACLIGARKLLASREIPLTVRCGNGTPAARLLTIAGLSHVLDLS